MSRFDRAASRLSLLALSGWALAAGSQSSASAPAPAAPAGGKAIGVHLGPPRFSTAAPEAWASASFDDSRWDGPSSGPFAPRPPGGAVPAAGAPGTRFDAGPGGSLFLRARFDVDDPARVRLLELRVRYADGFVAYVNGREVARRGLGPGPAARPSLAHGPEFETVYLPVGPDLTGALQPKANLLAVEIRAGGAPGGALAAAGPAGDIALGAASGLRIVRGPYLIAPVEDAGGGVGVQVAWETDLMGSGAVTVEPADARPGEKPRVLPSGGPALRHVVAVTGLEHGRRYRYRVQATATGDARDTAAAGPFVLEAPAGRSRPFRFAVYGDMRYPGHDDHRRVVEGLVREAPPLIFNTGDLVGEGNEESNWQRYFEITAPVGALSPVVPALGNHDVARAGLGAAKSWGLFGLPSAAPAGVRPGWTSFDLGGVHFVILDSSQAGNAEQRRWLTADLARARRAHARAIFAFCHEGPWSHGIHGNTLAMEHDYAPVLVAGGVDLLFAGHDHIYERGVGVTPKGKLPYVVTGGGGAPLYDVSCAGAPLAHAAASSSGLPTCPRSVAAIAKAHHYLTVEVGDKGISLCPKLPDGAPLEPCVRYPAHAP